MNPLGRPREKWTDERREIVRRYVPLPIPRSEIVDMLNDASGRGRVTKRQLSKQAANLRVRSAFRWPVRADA